MSVTAPVTEVRVEAEAPLVRIDGLTRVFDLSKRWLNRVLEGSGRITLTAVDHVGLSIPRGETYALVGESGSGKSTIAKIAVGLLPPSAGSVGIAGVEIWRERDAAVLRGVRHGTPTAAATAAPSASATSTTTAGSRPGSRPSSASRAPARRRA